MGSFRQFLPVCAVLIVAAAASLRADFIATASLSPAADNATNSVGSGSVTVGWMASSDTFAYTLSWMNLTGPATMAHIHYGAAGVSGPIVIPFFMPSSPSGDLPATDSVSGTLTAADFMADPAGGINTIADVCHRH